MTAAAAVDKPEDVLRRIAQKQPYLVRKILPGPQPVNQAGYAGGQLFRRVSVLYEKLSCRTVLKVRFQRAGPVEIDQSSAAADSGVPGYSAAGSL